MAKPRLVVILVALAMLALTACSSTDTFDGTDTQTSASPSAPDVSPTPSASPAPPQNPTTVALNELTGGKTVELTTDTLPPPPDGFSADELAAFGDRAIDLIQRGISPDVAALSEDDAFDYVFANQYKSSTDEIRSAFEGVSTEYSYAWVVASRFEQPPTLPAKVLAARWQVTTSEGESVNGTEPVLQVALSVAVEHQVPDTTSGATTGSTVPIVIQRTVIIRGFRPLGGPEWAPAIGYQAGSYLGGKCALINGGVLTPATRPATIKEDLNVIRKYLSKPKTITPSTPTGNDLAKVVAKYCEDIPG